MRRSKKKTMAMVVQRETMGTPPLQVGMSMIHSQMVAQMITVTMVAATELKMIQIMILRIRGHTIYKQVATTNMTVLIS